MRVSAIESEMAIPVIRVLTTFFMLGWMRILNVNMLPMMPMIAMNKEIQPLLKRCQAKQLVRRVKR